jgi:hypothetical protein
MVQYSGNGHWYDFVNFADTGWLAAKQSAESTVWMGMTGHLATISNKGENAFIASIFHGNAYLGATDKASEGNWIWITGEPFTYSKWGHGEPNNATNSSTNEDYLMMWHSAGWPSPWQSTAPYEWNDIFNYNPSLAINNNSNGYIHGYFIEFEAPIPEPSIYVMMIAGLGMLGFAAHRRNV